MVRNKVGNRPPKGVIRQEAAVPYFSSPDLLSLIVPKVHYLRLGALATVVGYIFTVG